jgi:orotidine-5'-phosphate decarboxylase
VVATTALDRTILAIDNMQAPEIEKTLEKFSGRVKFIKLGLEQYCRYGKKWVQELQDEHQFQLFLDLKFHDIPNTVARAIEGLEGLHVHLLTIHLTGGLEMIRAAQEACKKTLPQAKVLGVSFLTSLGEEDLHQIFHFEAKEIPQRFEALFTLAKQGGIGGVVCSPNEAQIAKKIAPHLITVCPGIRFLDEIATQKQDQKRTADPAWAISNGVDYLVIGRSLTQSERLEERLLELSSYT